MRLKKSSERERADAVRIRATGMPPPARQPARRFSRCWENTARIPIAVLSIRSRRAAVSFAR